MRCWNPSVPRPGGQRGARLVTLVVLAWTLEAQAADPNEALPGRLPRDATPVHYDILIEPDAKALTFKGRERIDIVVNRETRAVTLNALDLVVSDVALDGGMAGQVALDGAQQTATLTFPRAIATGPHQLSLSFAGKIDRSAAGFFALDYSSGDGPRRMLSMQLEPADGRRVVPMWDEPAAKATFDLEVVIPREQVAFSNMPEASNAVSGATRHVRFRTTPKMSSYLLHLTVGDLERVSRNVAGVDVGVVTRRGAGAQAAFALDAAAEVLPWYNDYFGTPYPLPKLDMIAAPGQSHFFGAMENWGAIFYFEYALLVDPTRSGESDRQQVFEVVAHEVAHQWFGNLVTMAWWDDLWLNEGFASWMASKVMNALHPQWKPWLQMVSGSRERAMRLDAGSATHAVVRPVDSIYAANQAFDAIAYSKGEAVIRMIEEMVGESGFRDGIRRYMKAYAYGNAVTGQLWQEIEASTGKPVGDIARDFTLQPGVPLVTASAARCDDGASTTTLTQSRFETDERSSVPLSWRIPVRASAVPGRADASVIMAKDAPAEIHVATCDPLVVNAGQAGYFRTMYAPEEIERIRGAFAVVDEIDQLGILSDTAALGSAGLLPATTYLDFTSAVPADSDPLIWNQVARKLKEMDRVFDGSPEQGAWRRQARAKLRPQFDRVGWAPRPGQGDTVALLRESLITALGALGDASLIEEAHARFQRAPHDPSAMPAAIRQPVLSVTALTANRATWEEMLTRARHESVPMEKQRLYVLLGTPLDPKLARRALELALSGEPPATAAPAIITAVADRHPAMAFEFALANEPRVLAMIETSSRWNYIPDLARPSADAELAKRLRAYADRAIPAEARKGAEEAIAEIERRARSYTHSRPQLEAWVKAQ
jgi:aminopeptidase N